MIERYRIISGDEFPEPEAEERGHAAEPPTLPYIDIARDPIPPREWSVAERIPAQNVTLLSGAGGIGKSLLLLQLSAAHVLGRDWIGTLPVLGPVLYLACEDDDDEVSRRFEAIALHHGVSRRDMVSAGLHVLGFAGRDAVLGFADRVERIRPTPLFESLRRDAALLKPKLIVLDTAADVFLGKENDRAQTRQFITMLRGLALETGAAVILASHPSLTGIKNDSGLSGSTAWHNSVRARMYFRSVDDFDDPGLRVLEVKKNNYGPISENILLRWRNGVYVPEPRTGSLEQMAAQKKIDDLFLDLLRRFAKQGRNVSPSRSPTYAPTEFTRQPEAKQAKVKADDFAEAMERLLSAGKIKVATDGPPSRRRDRLVEPEGEPEPSNALPTPLPTPTNALATHTPHTPQCVGRGQGALEAPAPSNTTASKRSPRRAGQS